MTHTMTFASQGVFWMSFDDFAKYFIELTVCRLLPDHVEARRGGWLPSRFNCGEALAIEVYARTSVAVTAHQEVKIYAFIYTLYTPALPYSYTYVDRYTLYTHPLLEYIHPLYTCITIYIPDVHPLYMYTHHMYAHHTSKHL